MMATFADQLRQTIAGIRDVIPQAFGLRPYTVSLVVQEWTAAMGVAGATPTETITELSTQPKCVMLEDASRTWIGNSVLADAGGGSPRYTYSLGPFTPRSDGVQLVGEYDVADLLLPGNDGASTTRRVLFRIEGPECWDDARFQCVRVEQETSLHFYLVVTQVLPQ